MAILNKYKVLFFDLDHTLWDYELNSKETLSELFYKYRLSDIGFNLNTFLSTFNTENQKLWSSYNSGHLNRDGIRERRFVNILNKIKYTNDTLAIRLSDEYLTCCPEKTNIFPFTHQVLTYLEKNYTLAILTNGFDDVQHIKLKASGLTNYFKYVITSDSGYRKPSKEIFDFAFEVVNTNPDESLMIGDNLKTDILGAGNVAMDTVFFNPKAIKHRAVVTYEINCLSHLMKIL